MNGTTKTNLFFFAPLLVLLAALSFLSACASEKPGAVTTTAPATTAASTTAETTAANTTAMTARTTTEKQTDVLRDYAESLQLIRGKSYQNTIIKDAANDGAPQVKQSVLSGVLAAEIADFDGGGNEELLVVSLKNGTVKLAMYRAEDGQAVSAGSCTLAQELLAVTTENTDIFLKKTNGKILICCESQSSNAFGDGISWFFRAFSYKDGSFTKAGAYDYGGSCPDCPDCQAEIAGYQKAIGELGLSVQNLILQKRIAEQDKSAELLCTIDSAFDADYEAISDFLDGKRASLPPIQIKIH